MADQKVNELSTATPALTDYIMGMSGTAEYKALVSAVAKKIVEDYAGSSLAGSNQSVKAALDSLNSKLVVPATSVYIVRFNRDHPATITPKNDRYNAYIIMGFAQGVGSLLLGLTVTGETVTVRNLMTGAVFSSGYLTFTVTLSSLTIKTTLDSYSVFTVLCS